MSIFSIGSIWMATLSVMGNPSIYPPLEPRKTQGGFVVQALAGPCDVQAGFIGAPRVAQYAVGLVEAGEVEPELRPPRPDQDHALGDLQRAHPIADMQRADLEVVLQAQQHVGVAHRLRQMRLARRAHARRRAGALGIDRRTAVER